MEACKSSSRDRRRTLACQNCRVRKVKCLQERGQCQRCIELGLNCIFPTQDERKRRCSKSHVGDLEERIRQLEAELSSIRQRQRHRRPSSEVNPQLTPLSEDTDQVAGLGPDREELVLDKSSTDSVMTRLCSARSKLSGDEDGQVHYFGPTSSLHLSLSVTSSLVPWGSKGLQGLWSRRRDVPASLEGELLDLYFRYQNSIVQVVHQEAFMKDMQCGQTKYFSDLLLYSIFACGALLSDRPEIRALALSPSKSEDDEPYFMKRATELLRQELKVPQVTTIQALQLLGIVEGAQGNETRSWLYTGDSCRLVWDLGFHRHCRGSDLGNLSPLDLEVHQVVSWGCFSYDRLWAFYLGRPPCMKSGAIKVSKPGSSLGASMQMRLSGAFIDLMELVTSICDALDKEKIARLAVLDLDRQLVDWYSNLCEDLRYDPMGQPALQTLHMQYHSLIILLYRPIAGFGTSVDSPSFHSSNFAVNARARCTQEAIRIALILDDFEAVHGSGARLSGICLHIISTAASTLIVDLGDKWETGSREPANFKNELWSLKRCIRSLSELETTHAPGRQLRRLILQFARLCNLTEFMEGQVQKPPTINDGTQPPPFATTIQSLDVPSLSNPGDLIPELQPICPLDFVSPTGSNSYYTVDEDIYELLERGYTAAMFSE